jgi:hypothetical protein
MRELDRAKNPAALPAVPPPTGSIVVGNFASGIEPVGLVTATVDTPSVGKLAIAKTTTVVFNTTDAKLYRWNGSNYFRQATVGDLAADTVVAGTVAAGAIRAIDAAFENGAIQTADIGDAQITNLKVASGLSATKVTTGTLTVGAGGITVAGNLAVGGSLTLSGTLTIGGGLSIAGTLDGNVANFTNLNATNLTVGTINGARYGDNTIAGSKIISLDVTKLNAGTISVSISLTSPQITSTSGSNVIQLGVTAGVFDVFGSIAKTRITQGEIKCTVNSTSENTFISGSTLSMDNTSGVGVVALDTFGNDNLSGRLWLGNSSGSIKWRAGRMSDGNFGTIYNETHYGLWTASNNKKFVSGFGTMNGSGHMSIATGLSSVDSAFCCNEPGGSGWASEYGCVNSISGGTVNFASSNSSSSGVFLWMAMGNA